MSLVLGQQNPAFFGFMPTFRKYSTKIVLVSQLSEDLWTRRNSFPSLFPKDFLGHFLIQSGTTFDSRLNFIHWTVWYPRFTKNLPSSYCWPGNPHSHTHIKELFHFHAKCCPGLSVCHTAARQDEVDLLPLVLSEPVRPFELYWKWSQYWAVESV